MKNGRDLTLSDGCYKNMKMVTHTDSNFLVH